MHRSETVETRHLVKRGKVYFVVLDVPKPLQPTLKKKVLTRTTGTGDILQARERRDTILAEFKARIARAKVDVEWLGGAATFDWLAQQADKAEAKAAELIRLAELERDAAQWARRKIAAALMPTSEPTITVLPCAAAGVSFREAAEACIASRQGTTKSDRWTPSLTTYAFPTIGAVPVSDLSTDHVLSVLQPMWATIPDAGRRLRNVIAAVLDYARTRGWRTGDNPAAWDGHLEHVLPQATRIKPAGQHEAMRWQDAPAFCSRLSSLATTPAHTLLFAILTAGRKDEILGATWPEFDLEGRVWTIPAGRMKAGREHRVPLSDAAMAVVRGMQAQSLPRHGELVFPGRAGKLSSATFYRVLHQLGETEATGHGFRSSFRDWCADNGHERELAELALAHVVGGKVERAYQRSDLLERRRGLMQEWGRFCTFRVTLSHKPLPEIAL